MVATVNEPKAPARFFYFKELGKLFAGIDDSLLQKFEDLRLAIEADEGLAGIACLSLSLHICSSLREYGMTLERCYATAYKEVSYVSELGANKYGEYSYREGLKVDMLLDAVARHLIHYITGDLIDHESGKDHRYHMLANLLILMHYIDRGDQ